MKKLILTTAVVALTTSVVFARGALADSLEFDLVPTDDASYCLPGATGVVSIEPSSTGNEVMRVTLRGMPPQIEVDVFITQVPNFPFGLSWYQGDIETNERGAGRGVFIGRFNEETFTVAPGVAEAPVVHGEEDPFPDAYVNPVTAPIHQFHVGIWFDSPDDAAAAGCPSTVTPFNGEHNAGIQIFNTGNFPDAAGPLIDLKP